MERWITGLLLVVGLINFFPVLGIISAEFLANAYDIPPPQGDLLILMRHRALLFGIVGSIIIASAFRRHLRPTAACAALASMVGFVALALAADGYGDKLRTVMIVDIVGTLLLLLAVWMGDRVRHGS